MIEIENYGELLSLIETKTQVENRDGVEWVIKPIPDLDATGELDPRVFAINSRPGPVFPDDPDIHFIRSIMGFDNYDVTTTGIVTVSMDIPGPHGLIPVRLYSPKEGENLPALVFFHGGGFIGGSLKTVENPCKAIAEKANAVVISVDYRLAPEHPFPIGFEDCFETVKWVYENAKEIRVNPDKIGVAGDSAGGNLSAVCSLKDRDLGTNMIKFQALIYPVVDLDREEQKEYAWSREAYTINREDQREMIHRGLGMMEGPRFPYCEPNETKQRYISPILQEDLSGLPEALIIAAEFDPLRIEDEAYAKKLNRFGNKVTYIEYKGMDHAFIDKIGVYPQAEDCMREIAEAMKRIFA